ncbi:MAG TPA: hypothetical protein VK436_07790, partial [Methanocella sp.]|nr:hypothetical protein [Methanocella sp.]
PPMTPSYSSGDSMMKMAISLPLIPGFFFARLSAMLHINLFFVQGSVRGSPMSDTDHHYRSFSSSSASLTRSRRRQYRSGSTLGLGLILRRSYVTAQDIPIDNGPVTGFKLVDGLPGSS